MLTMTVNNTIIGQMVEIQRRDSKDNLKRSMQRFNPNNLLGQQSHGLQTRMTHNKLIVQAVKPGGETGKI